MTQAHKKDRRGWVQESKLPLLPSPVADDSSLVCNDPSIRIIFTTVKLLLLLPVPPLRISHDISSLNGYIYIYNRRFNETKTNLN